MKITLAAVWAICIAGLAFASGELEQMNRKLKAELKALENEAAGLENECLKLEESIRISGIAADLMSGRRKNPPQIKTIETVFYNDASEPVFFDATKGKVKNRDVWLTDKMRPGATYRFEAEVKVEEFAGADGVKFGGYAPVKGSETRWPGCPKTGKGTYGWQKISFTYTLPHGGSFMLSAGPGGGTGRVWFRNIRGLEVKEVEE